MEKLVALNANAALAAMLVSVLEAELAGGAAVHGALRQARIAAAAAEQQVRDETIMQDPDGYENKLRKMRNYAH